MNANASNAVGGCGGCGACASCSGGAAASMGGRFESAMQAEGVSPAAGSMDTIASSLSEITSQLSELVQMLGQLIKAMSGKSSGGSLVGSGNRITPVEGNPTGATGGGATGPTGANGLGGLQGPSARIPDPTSHVQQVQLGSRTMTIGSDGSASAAEVQAAASEMQRMYDVSPTFRSSIDSAGASNLTVTLGRRGDNTSWGGGGRVFLNLNNIEAGNNDRFQGIVGHEFAHAANGLGHGAELDSIEDRVRAES